jgi:predicted amidohydrolase
MTIRIAVVQPITNRPPEDERNVEDAIQYVEQASRQGVDIVAFPESYPGPWRMPASFDPGPVMVDAAHQSGMYIQYGTLEPISDSERTAFQVSALASPDHPEPLVYRRTHPPGPWLYGGGDEWEFEYVAADEFPVFETKIGIVGLEVCSEVYMPEVSRALALRGAELIFIPAGTEKPELWSTWRHLIWARAIENLAVVVTTQNMFSPHERGLAMVAGPEEVWFESTAPGLFIVDFELTRARELRELEDGAASRNGAKAGVLSQWQRPELYEEIWQRSSQASRR